MKVVIKILFLFLICSSFSFGQGKSPYPIIFVHGLNSDYRTWSKDGPNNDVFDYLENAGLQSGGNLNVTLDYLRSSTSLNNTKEEDVHLFSTNPDIGDFYTVNFCVHSNGSIPSDIPGFLTSKVLVTSLVNNTDVQIGVTIPVQFNVDDIIRIGDEFMQVTGVGGTDITVSRNILGSEASNHYPLDVAWNLSNESNQASIVKQGYGLKLAIDAIKSKTGAKKVILVGHSMGGLAIREYLRSYYKNDVAKVVTIGTPHLGSKAAEISPQINNLLGIDIRSDAIRDLSYNYNNSNGNPDPPYGSTMDNGIYLFGGDELYLQRETSFYSYDVNANGVGDVSTIDGISTNLSTLPTGVAYTWIVSQWNNWGPNIDGDGCVRLQRQFPWVQKMNGQPLIEIGDTLMAQDLHTDETLDYNSLIRGLDEPDDMSLAYEIGKNSNITGFITYQTNYNDLDIDLYKVVLNANGFLSISIDGSSSSGVGQIALLDSTGTGNPLIFQGTTTFPTVLSYPTRPGTYYIRVRGLATSSSYEFPYTLTTSFVELQPTVAFSTKSDFTTGTYPYSVSIGDFNGDGKPDMAVTGLSASVSVLLNTTTLGATTPTFSPKTDFSTTSYSASVAIGDFNGDGKPDMAAGNIDFGSNTVSVFLNTTPPGATTPTFSPETDFTTGTDPHSVSIGDINGDGKPDMVAANWSSATASVLLNTTSYGATTPSFSTKSDFTTGNNPSSVSIGDFNKDGKPDMAVANYSDNTFSIFLNTTTPGATIPTFSTKTDFTTGNGPNSVSIGDFNGDGKQDIAVTNNNSGNVSVFLNTTTPGATTPTFSPKTDFTTGGHSGSVSTGDFNGDGKPDMAVANYSDNTVSIFLNTTTPGATIPTFSTKTDFTTGNGPNSVSIGDFNGDGKQDIAVTNNNSGNVSVFLNTTVPPLPIELTTFSALVNKNLVALSWHTATEVNNYGFEVERYSVGSWSKIGFVQGNGTTNSPKEYSFQDKNLRDGQYSYRLKQIDRDGKFEYSQSVEVEISVAPKTFALEQNYPNPFNPSTNIAFSLPAKSFVSLKVFDLLGREVATLISEELTAGNQTRQWNASNMSSGIYFYRLQAGSFVKTKKLVLIR